MDDRDRLTLPNVWGEGAIFAFSALDGNTDIRTELVATTLEHEPGFRIRCPDEAEFFPRFYLDGKPAGGFPNPGAISLVCSDAIDLLITAAEETRIRLRYAVIDNTTIAGKVECDDLDRKLTVELVLSSQNGSQVDASFLGEGDARRRKFEKPFSAEFVLSSGEVPSCDFEKEFNKRLSFFKDLPRPDDIDERIARTLMKCFSVLKANIQSAQGDLRWEWSTPDRYPHRYAWLWDSAFQAMGIRHISLEAAENTIRAVLSKQRPDGFIPHMMTPYDEDSEITQPPLLCWAAWHLFDSGSSVQFIESIFSKLVKYLKRFLSMDLNGNGLLEWSDGGQESGMDNSPRFDEVENPDAVDLNSFVAGELFYLGKIAAHLDESSTVEYCRKKRSILASKMNHLLWNDEDGIYYDLGPDGKHVRVKTAACFAPIFAGVVPEERIVRLVKHLKNEEEFNRPFPVSSVAGSEPSFCDDMWRGPVWANYNYLIIDGLRRYRLNEEADYVARRTIEEISRWYVEEGVIFEYFDSEAKTSPRKLHRKGKIGGDWLNTCIKDYSWTAAVFAELVLRAL